MTNNKTMKNEKLKFNIQYSSSFKKPHKNNQNINIALILTKNSNTSKKELSKMLYTYIKNYPFNGYK